MSGPHTPPPAAVPPDRTGLSSGSPVSLVAALVALADTQAALDATSTDSPAFDAATDALEEAVRVVNTAAGPVLASPQVLSHALTDAAIFRRCLRECVCEAKADEAACSFDQRNQGQAAVYEELLPAVAYGQAAPD